MAITDILEQVKTLSFQERKELAKLLIDSLDVKEESKVAEADEHWGKSLNQLLNEISPIDLGD